MRRGVRPRKVISAIVLVVALLGFMFPVVWMFLTSFKTEAEYFSYPPVFIPGDFSLRNYVNAMALPPVGRGGLQGLRDSLIIANTIFNLPFVIWLLKGFFDELSVEMEQAATLEGCSPLGAFVRISLPLVAPGLVATALFSFIFAWNEFMLALLLTRRNVRTLTIIVPSLVGGHEILWGEIASIGTLAIIPGIVLALLLQRYLVRGLSMGAVKG